MIKYLKLLFSIFTSILLYISYIIGAISLILIYYLITGGSMLKDFIKKTIDKFLAIKHLEWYLAGIAILGAILNASAFVISFFVWMIANTGLAIVNWKNKKFAQMSLFLAYNGICIYGIIIWLSKGIK